MRRRFLGRLPLCGRALQPLGRALALALALAPPLAAGCSDEGSTTPVEPPRFRDTGLAPSCARGTRTEARPAACNGAPELCDRTYDAVVVPMTHNAMAASAERFTPPNQTHGLARQLADGVRGLMLDVHYWDPDASEGSAQRIDDLRAVDQVWLCHGPCALGRTRLLDGLCAITAFLDASPGEVISVIFETRVADADLAAVLEASGLASYAYVHGPGAPWPTLRAMIDAGKRLVVFVETGGGAPPYLHPAFDANIRDTPYTFERAADFSCAVNRGKAGDPLFLVNHWLSKPFGDITFAREVNAAAVLDARITKCTAEAGRKPTFVGVDFYEVGDLFAVVRRANGL